MELSSKLQEKVKMLAKDHAASAGSQRTLVVKEHRLETALPGEKARLRESELMALTDVCHAIS